jgi:plasmid stability protein
MATTILQVRELPESVVAVLRERAARQGVSLSAYVRELLSNEAAMPTMDETLARIATRAPVEIDDSEILAAIHEGRR